MTTARSSYCYKILYITREGNYGRDAQVSIQFFLNKDVALTRISASNSGVEFLTTSSLNRICRCTRDRRSNLEMPRVFISCRNWKTAPGVTHITTPFEPRCRLIRRLLRLIRQVCRGGHWRSGCGFRLLISIFVDESVASWRQWREIPLLVSGGR